MPTQTFESTIPTSADELFRWHTRLGAFERLCPPWQSLEIIEPAPVENGTRVRLRLKKGPLTLRWTAEHRDVTPGRGFTDVQIAGPFARWEHRHEFTTIDSATVLRDRIDYELPGGVLGRALGGSQVRRDLSTTFAFRHRTTARDLARHGAFAEKPRQQIAITGSSGLVGGNLLPFLTTGGHRVLRLLRAPVAEPETATWRPEAGLLAPEGLPSLDAIVHLAGENIAGARWTTAQKERIRASRIDATRHLVRSLGRLSKPPGTLVCASAIGWYGARGADLVDEGDASGDGFLAEVCREWEEAALEATQLGMRVVTLRFGIILTPAGGALAKMLLPFRLGAGGRIGDGRQYMSWVSIDDAIGAIHQTLFDERFFGPVNVVAPEAVTNREFTKALGRVLRRPTLVPLPALGARVAFGQMADEMLLSGVRVRPRRLEENGFDFADPDLERTLARLLGKVEMA